ncbi:MAG: AraC family transcriptional regulator [Clostridiales bacterium]|nr:AraC family transcriptional regulator [Clostridiales bacterium]
MQAFVENRDNQLFMTRGVGYAFPLHLHTHLELVLVDAGSIQITVGDQSRRLDKGSLALIFPNQIHSYDRPSPGNHNTILVLDLSFVGEYVDTLLRHHPEMPFLSGRQVHGNIRYAMEQMYLEYEQEGRREIFTPFAHLMVARILESVTLLENSSAGDRQLTWRIVDYVNRHYQEHISLEDMARALGMSKYRLSRQFAHLFGDNFSTYVNSIRLYRACNLLAGTDLSVTDISEESGFGSLRTFFRVFQAEHGMTPQEFRNSRKTGG